MKLSQAMRAGARKTKAIQGRYSDQQGGTCAMGAAALGCDIIDATSPENMVAYACGRLHVSYPELKLPSPCPFNDGLFVTLHDLIIHFNDGHEWSRERIAGWIESHIEVPTYSLLQMKEYMEFGESALAEKTEAK